jgi:hypothetical protein
MREELTDYGAPFLSEMTNAVWKATEENGQWIIYLKASDESLDQDGEVMKSQALKSASDYFMEHGVISWDHQHKLTKHPEYIIGEPLEVRFSESHETFAKAFLYKENDIAKGVYKNILSGAKRLGSSVGGGILKKSGPDNKEISRVVWDEIAITHKPVNMSTYGAVSMVPFKVFFKALMVGSGVDASQFTGGRALSPESLQGSTVQEFIPDSAELTAVFSVIMKSAARGEIDSYSDMKAIVSGMGYADGVADRIVHYIVLKMPEVVRQL